MPYERKRRGDTNLLRLRLCLCLLVINGFCAYRCLAAEPLVFDLLWQPKGSASASVPIVTNAQTTFAKEPDFEGRQVIRGLLPCGEHQEEYMAYIWDCNESRLYIDKNRNGNLTDDPTGIYKSRSPYHRRGNHDQSFRDVEISLLRESLQYRYILTISFRRYHQVNRYRRDIYVGSRYSGLMELEGEAWHIEVADNLDGILNDKDRMHIVPYQPGQNDEPSSGLPLQETLFLDGRYYHCDYRFLADSSNSAKVQLSLTQPEVPRDLQIVFKAERSSGRHRPKRLAMDLYVLRCILFGDCHVWSGPNDPRFNGILLSKTPCRMAAIALAHSVDSYLQCSSDGSILISLFACWGEPVYAHDSIFPHIGCCFLVDPHPLGHTRYAESVLPREVLWAAGVGRRG